MKYRKILSIGLIAYSIVLTITVGCVIIGKGVPVAADNIATGTATDTYGGQRNPDSEKFLDMSKIEYECQTLAFNSASIVFPQGFLSKDELNGVTNISIVYSRFNSSNYYSKNTVQLLNTNGCKVIDTGYYFNLLKYNNTVPSTILELDKPIIIEISLSDLGLDGFNKSNLKIFYVDWNGNIEEMPTTFKNDKLTFSTTHFSVFYIGQVQDGTATPIIWKTINTASTKTNDLNKITRVAIILVGSVVIGTAVTLIEMKKYIKKGYIYEKK